MSGAGYRVATALIENKEPPQEFLDAIHEICQTAQTRGCRLWIDAEQQVLQQGIDAWTIQLMRHYNKNGRGIVYNTLQAYLKASRKKLKHQLALAEKEGWTLSIKLVRGAYIDNDRRELIHDTKSDTDDSYNAIVRDLLTGTNLGLPEHRVPKAQLFLAGHNPESIAAAWHLIQDLGEQNKLKILPDFGQLQGMGDEIGCRLLQQCEELRTERGPGVAIPKVYKCLTWGSLQECMQYLFRRAVENRGGTDRMRDGLSAYVGELRRRYLGRF
nr:putative proline dehydrogenase, mitochondrial [Quercus suber]